MTTRQNRNFGLSDLIYPVTESNFFRDYYGRTPFFATENKFTAVLLTPQDIIAQVECLCMEYGPDFTLASDGDILPLLFVPSIKELGKIDKLLANRWTLAVHGYSFAIYPISALASQLDEDLKWHANINIYYTPANTQGFGLHTDNHDVFIWQQAGKKAWKVYKQGCSKDDSNLLIDIVLEAGQVLYIPENCLHEGIACTNENSLHLTIGFLSRYSQVKKALFSQLEAWFSSEMTTGFHSMSQPDPKQWPNMLITKDEMLYVLDSLGSKLNSEELRETSFTTPANQLSSQLSPDEVTQNMLAFERHKTFKIIIASHQLTLKEDGSVLLEFNTGKLMFKAFFVDALQKIVQMEVFNLSDLPLNIDHAISLCRVLIAAAVIVPEDGGQSF